MSSGLASIAAALYAATSFLRSVPPLSLKAVINLIRTYSDELVSEEERNNRKLDVVSRAGLLLMVGVVALACESGTLAIEHLAMSISK
jgi:hypothetical protein